MRWPLWLLPRRFREQFGDELTGLASELVRDARAAGGRRAQLARAGRELAAFTRLAVSLRRRPARQAFSEPPERSTRMFDSLRSDVRWALRFGARRPLFAIAVSVTLAVCIATASTAFGLAAAVLWRPLPFGEADRLVFVWEAVDRDGERQPFRVTGSRFAEWRTSVG